MLSDRFARRVLGALLIWAAAGSATAVATTANPPSRATAEVGTAQLATAASIADTFETQATAQPAQLSPGQRVTLTVTVTSAAAVAGTLDIEVYDPSGQQVFQRLVSGQQYTAGGTVTYPPSTWRVPDSLPAGSYTVRLGVFDAAWTPLHWNDRAATFVVAGPPVGPPGGGNGSGGALPPRPAAWPPTMALGLADPPGGATALRASTGVNARYQYLAGGVNTPDNWHTWGNGAPFVTAYVRESAAAGLLPVLTYYTLRQSLPGAELGDESAAALTNLATPATLQAWLADLVLVFQQAAAAGGPVVLHVEPDLWGFAQARTLSDDAAEIPAVLNAAASGQAGLEDLSGLPDNLAGVAQAIVRLRDRFAPNVDLAYALSLWGTSPDFDGALSDTAIDVMAGRAADFERSLGAPFDLTFGEISDRDAGFRVAQGYHPQNAWWDAADYERHARFLARYSRETAQRVVLWQLPLGNSRMRAVDGSWGHYQDNRVELLLDDPSRSLLAAYAEAGVIGLLFGPGAPGATCACDASGDGVTDPPPVNGNDRPSLSADDDGGFFRERARAYATAPLSLP